MYCIETIKRINERASRESDVVQEGPWSREPEGGSLDLGDEGLALGDAGC